MESNINIILALILILIIIVCVSYYIGRRYVILQMNKVDQILDDIISGKTQDIGQMCNDTINGRLQHKANRIIELNDIRTSQMKNDKKIIEEMIGDISHQIKTPMSNILIYGELVSDSNIPINDRIEFSERIIDQSKKINCLIESLTKLARLESGVIDLRIVDNDLRDSIEESISAVKGKLLQKNIAIELSDIGPCTVRMCTKWTEEAIINVLDNAIKYSDKGGRISISVERMPLFTVLNISDLGFGIHESEYTEIFKRFYRAKDNKVKEGVGLGLHIARMIMENQGGYMKVTSKIGVGSTFSLFFQNCNNKPSS